MLELGRGLKLFAAPRGAPRARRASDLLLLVPSLVLLAALVAAYPPSGFERSLERLFGSVPGWLAPVWGFLADALWLWAVALLVAAFARRRFAVDAQALAALILAAALGILAARGALGTWPELEGALFGTGAAPRFPHVRVGSAAAVVLIVSPHLVRPLRRLGHWLIVLGALGAAVSGAVTPWGALAGVLLAVVAASTVRLVAGTSAGRPGLADVEAGLAELGVRAHSLEDATRQVAGVYHVRALDDRDRPLLVKVYGRDAYDSQLVSRVWRSLWYRGGGPAFGLTRLHAAEHEAFVTLLARNAGVPTRAVVTAGATIDDDAILVLRGDARPLGSLAPGELDDGVLAGAWASLALLCELRVAHGQLDPATVALVEDAVGFLDLGGASVAPGADQLATDRAQLLATTAVLAGQERALAAAAAAVGDDGVAELLPFLQSAAFGPGLRGALKEAGLDADDLREHAATTVSAEPPELARLRRVSPRSAIQGGLLALASYTIITAAAGVDWDEVGSTLADASWAWLVAAFVVAQLPRVTQALSTLGSVPGRLPLGPVYAMQLATGYMNVALPSNLARMAVNVRFFQRQGLPAPTAIASGAIDSFAGTVIQAVLLALLVVFSESSLSLELDLPSGGSRTLALLLVSGVVLAVATVALVPRLRELVVGTARRFWPDVRTALRTLRASNKLALLLGGNLATEILFAIALGLFCRGLGYDLSLTELLVVNISVSLLASFVPVPGGIGVAELGLTVGLTSAGMTAEAALGAVLLYRISTYYLPPLWGLVAMRRLQRARYL